MSQATPALIQRRRNWALLEGTVVMALAIVSFIPGLYSLTFPGPALLTWISVVLPAIAVVFFSVGLKRAFGQPDVYRGKILGSILTVPSVLLLAGSILLFVHGRDIPASASAPKVGQKAPDFTLTDTHGQPIALSQLLAGSGGASEKPPKAVLLVFYRGYW